MDAIMMQLIGLPGILSTIFGFILGICLTAVVNQMIARTRAKTFESDLQRQIEGAKREAENIIKSTQIDAAAETIKKKETKILEFETTLKAEGSKIEALESELKKLDLRIEGTTVGVGKNIMIEEYNQKIEQHDTLVNSYNKVYSEYGKLYDECEEDIITHDSLVESYNAGIIPQMTQSQLSEGEVRDKIYIVEVGDSLGKIAQKFGTTTEKIVARNKLVNPSLIRPGQKLIIPTE